MKTVFFPMLTVSELAKRLTDSKVTLYEGNE